MVCNENLIEIDDGNDGKPKTKYNIIQIILPKFSIWLEVFGVSFSKANTIQHVGFH